MISLSGTLSMPDDESKEDQTNPAHGNLLLRYMLTSPEHTPQVSERQLSPKYKCLLRTQLKTDGRGSLTIPGPLTTWALQPAVRHFQQSNLLTGSQHRVQFLQPSHDGPETTLSSDDHLL